MDGVTLFSAFKQMQFISARIIYSAFIARRAAHQVSAARL
jgi:hypothetical protein